MLKRIATSAAILFSLFFATPALAQSQCPPIIYGAVLTVAQWQSCFTAKNDVLGYKPVNKAGDFMLGKLITAPSSAASAGFNLPAGTAPTSPVDGDMWTTSAGLFLRAGGVTYGPISGSSGCSGFPTLTGFVTTPGGSCVTSLAATITVPQGGLGATSLTNNALLYGNGTSPISTLAPVSGSTRKFVVGVSSGAPAYDVILNADLPLAGAALRGAIIPALCVGHFFSVGIDPGTASPNCAQPATTDISGLGTSATKNVGNSVADPGTGALETLWPYKAAVTGASKAFGASDIQFATRRSNSGSAMTDTFPISSTSGMANGAVIYVGNSDATATDTITAGSGTVFSAGATQAVTAGRGVMFVLDTTGGTPTWRSHNNDLNQVLAANNGTDFASAATTLANLGGIGAASPAFTGTFTGVNGTLSGQFQTNTESIGTATSIAELMIGGTYTSANSNAMFLNGTHASSVTGGQTGIQMNEVFNPSGASVSSISGITSNPRITAANTLAPSTFISIQGQLTTLASYAPTIANGYDFYAQDFTQGGTNPLSSFQQYFAAAASNGNGNTSGTVTNYGFRYNSATAAAASGGTILNYGFYSTLPTGSGAGTVTNYGLRITGNGGSGGAGTTTNWALFDDSTANASILGKLRVGSNTAPTHALDVTGTIDATVLSQAGTAVGTAAFLASTTDTTFSANSNSLLPTQAATKAYVDAHSAGLNYKTPVATATTANITLSGEQTIDGVLTSASRVLVKNQSTTANNGIYVSASGAWARSSDATSASDLLGVTVLASGGTTQSGTQWNCGCTALTVGTSPIVFVQISLPTSSYTAGSGLTLTTNQFAIDTSIVLTLTGSQTVTNKSIDAGQITGTIANAILPLGGSSLRGAVIPALCVGNFFSVGIDPATSSISCQQPAWSNLTGTPTTLSGYAITDAQGLNANLTALAALASTGIVKRTGTNTFGFAVSGTDFAPATTGSSILKASSGGFANAVANTDYLAVASPVFTGVENGPTYIGTASSSSRGVPAFNLEGAGGQFKEYAIGFGGGTTWTFGTDNTASSSTRTGENYELCEWTNSSAFIDCPLTIPRATGIPNFANGLQSAGSTVLSASDIGNTVQANSLGLGSIGSAIDASSPKGVLGTPGTHLASVMTLGPCLNYTLGGSGNLSLNCTTLTGYGITDGAQKAIYQPFVSTAQFDKANGSPALVPGLSITAVGGKTYTFDGLLDVTLDPVGGMRFRMSGSATMTSIAYEASFTCNSGNGTYNNAGRLIDITTNFTLPSVGCTSGQIHYTGAGVVNAGGTFGPEFAQQAVSGTSSVLVNSKSTYSQTN